MMRNRDYKHTYSIRKLTIGAVSVMFGALIFGVSTTQAHADTVENGESAQTEEVQSNKQDSQGQSQSAVQTDDNAQQSANNQANTQAQSAKVSEVAKNDEQKAEAMAQTEQTQTQAKQEDENKSVSEDVKQADSQTAANTQSQVSQTSETSKAENTNTVNVTKLSKENNNSNTNGLATSLARDVDNVNINDWDYGDMGQGNIEVIRKNGFSYTGNVVVPNTEDLIKAGKITTANGKAYINAETLHRLTITNGVTSITISKNNNGKLYVKPGTDGKASLHFAFANFDGYNYTPNPDLQKIDVSALDTSTVTNMSQMIECNTNLTEIDGLENWDVSQVVDLTNAFWRNPKLTSEALAGLSNWDTRSLTGLATAFAEDTGLTNLNFLRNWNTQNLTSLGTTFWLDTNLADISGIANWDVSKVTNFASTFLYDSKIQGLVNLTNWKINDNANTFDMFYPGGRDATPLMVLVKSGAENINKGTTPFGAGSSQHYLYKVEVNGQIVETVPAKAFNSASEAVTEIQNNLNSIAASRNLNRDGYTFSWKGENQYGNTGAYELYVATWTQPTQPTQPTKPTQPTNNNSDQPTTPVNPTSPTEPTTPVQPTAPVTPSNPTTPSQSSNTPTQPSNTPALPENNPNSNNTDNGKHEENNSNKTNNSGNKNGQTVKPQAEKPTNNSSRKAAPEVQTAKGEQEHPSTLSNRSAKGNNSQKQAEKRLPQTGVKESSAILGFILAGLGLFGLAVDRKRKNN